MPHSPHRAEWSSRLYTPRAHHPLAALELPEDGLAPLTHWMQRWMYDRLHPPQADCSAEKFIVMHEHQGGIGAYVSVSTAVLALAVEEGRQFVFARTTDNQHLGQVWCNEGSYEWCSPTDRSMQNWVLPPSACSLADVPTARLADKNVLDCYGSSSRHPARHGHPGVTVPYCVARHGPNEVSITNESRFINLRGTALTPYDSILWMPTEAQLRLRAVQPGMSAYEMRYWWRVQASAYLMRLSARSVQRVAELRWDDALMLRFPNASVDHPVLSGSSVLPAGTISIHVREGDKGMESKPLTIESYFTTAAETIAANPLGLARVVFLSTENPANVKNLDNFTKRPVGPGYLKAGWYGVASSMPRHNSNGHTQNKLYGTERMTAYYFLQMLLALECDAFIGWRASGWNRLVDALRCVWVPKCKHPYIDVGTKRYVRPGEAVRDDVYSWQGPYWW